MLLLFLPLIILLIIFIICTTCKNKRKRIRSCYNDLVKEIKPPKDSQKVWAEPFESQLLSVAIVEPREHELLPYVLYNMAHIYGGTDVSLYIFHGNKNIEYLNEIVKDWKNVQLVNLNVDNLTINDYNILLTSKSFYDHFKSEYVLIFQTDSIIRRKIDQDFFNYDYVGAPWKDNCEACVGNGGFSLRKVETMKHICENYVNTYGNEDLFFANELYKHNFSLPDPSTASRFSIEMTYNDDPCGFHAIDKFHSLDKIERLFENLI